MDLFSTDTKQTTFGKVTLLSVVRGDVEAELVGEKLCGKKTLVLANKESLGWYSQVSHRT